MSRSGSIGDNPEDELSEAVYAPHILSKNRFSGINNLNQSTSASAVADANIKTKYCPPITIRGQSYQTIRNILTTNDSFKNSYKLKFTTFGLRVQCKTPLLHKSFLEILQTNKYEYFSYQIQNDRPLTFVLAGLPSMDSDEIKNELIHIGILNVIDVQPIDMKKKRYSDHCLYIVKCKRLSTSLKELRQIKQLFNIIIKWNIYRRKQTGPLLCSRCQHYGHASFNCRLEHRCSFCGKNGHDIKTCEKAQEAKNQVNPEIIPVCCNCHQNHRPISDECPKKQEYIQIKLNLNRRRQNHYTHTKKPEFAFHDQSFPELPKLVPKPTMNLQSPKQNMDNQPVSSNTRVPVVNNINKNTSYDKNNDLYSLDELLSIAKEIFLGMANCKTKADQIMFITEISVKYVYNNGCN